MIEFRDYQKNIISQGTEILKDNGFLYLAMEVRTGKTLTSLGIADQMNVEHVLFLTKKKAISSIVGDYDLMCPASFILFTINYESMHKLPQNIKWDIIIIDEAHSLGAIPKPNKRARDVKTLIKKNKSKVILMSGTPTPESYSQMYHQVYGIPNNPFREHVSFYKFAKDYVDVRQRKINSMMINDYSRGLETIVDKMNPYTIRFTQKEAGFRNDIVEEVLEVDMSELTYKLTSKLKKDLVVEGNEDVILADTPVKLMMKLHQMYSGTVKFESGNSKVLDHSKAEFIFEQFKHRKIGIFYKFKAELLAIQEIFEDRITTDLEEFNSTNKSIALQIQSGREGISLKLADCLVYYNIDFSATSYWQSRDRMTTKERLENEVFWILTEGGIESKIYKAVSKKKNYTLNHFKRDLLTLN